MIRFALAFVLGAFCLQQQPVLPNLYWGVLPAIAFLVYSSLLRRKLLLHGFYGADFIRSACVIAFSFMLGLFWAAMLASLRMADALPQELQNKTITLVGVVSSPVEQLQQGERFRFDVEQVLTDDAHVPSHISLSYYSAVRVGDVASLVSTRYPSFKVGERWQLIVKLKRPHGTQNPHGYDFEAWALAENIRATGTIRTKAQHQKLQSFVWRPKYVVEYLREKVRQRIADVLPAKPYAGILQALVMGDDAAIAADDWELFLKTGTTHLMSISGLHITMLSGLAFALTSLLWRRYPGLVMRLPTRKAATLAGVVIALLYVLLAGFAVPAQRTFYMLLVFAAALWSGRQVPISHVLALALLTVTLLDPWAVISAGFWLSFAAVAVLAYAFAGRIGQTHWLRAAVYSQWAVTLGMLPLLLFMFHQASIISPLANAIAIPLISLIVTPLALLGSFLPVDILLELAHRALEVSMEMLRWLNHAPHAVWQQHAPPAWTLLPAALGMIWLLLPNGFPLRSIGLVGLLPMLLITPARISAGDMKVAILDVGQGLSVVVQTANHTLLYDAGPKAGSQSDAAKRVILPYLHGEGIVTLDKFMLSHDDIDHAGGAETLLDTIAVTQVSSSLTRERFNDFLEGTRQPLLHQHCRSGQHWEWDGVHFDVLYPLQIMPNTSDNNQSCVLRVRSAAGSLLLTGDIEKFAEQQILAQHDNNSDEVNTGSDELNAGAIIKTDVLVAPHHGSKTSSSYAFVAATSPALVVFANGYLNRFRHPNAAVVARYRAVGSQILRSDYDGAILLEFTSVNTKNAAKNPSYRMTRWREYSRRYWHERYP